jgi:hypothetical protein
MTRIRLRQKVQEGLHRNEPTDRLILETIKLEPGEKLSWVQALSKGHGGRQVGSAHRKRVNSLKSAKRRFGQ